VAKGEVTRTPVSTCYIFIYSITQPNIHFLATYNLRNLLKSRGTIKAFNFGLRGNFEPFIKIQGSFDLE
jgi:hypothetical protein